MASFLTFVGLDGRCSGVAELWKAHSKVVTSLVVQRKLLLCPCVKVSNELRRVGNQDPFACLDHVWSSPAALIMTGLPEACAARHVRKSESR